MNHVNAVPYKVPSEAHRYLREGVLMWDAPPSQQQPPYDARFVTDEGVFPVTSWVDPPLFDDTGMVDKVCAVILCLPDNQMVVVSVERDANIDPLEVMPATECPFPSVLVDAYERVQSITTPALRRFVSDVLSLTPVFYGFWWSTAGAKHHAWPGGLAWHSLEVVNTVAAVMASPAPQRVNFTLTEREVGVVAALLHDVGKTVSYTDEGYCTERALVLGHELLGVELIRQPLETLRATHSKLADALTALLLSRTRFACGSLRYEAIRQVISRADVESAKRNTKPR